MGGMVSVLLRYCLFAPHSQLLLSLNVLANLHGNGDTNHPKVLAEFKEIQDQINFEKTNVVTSYKALTEPRMFKRVILGMSVQMWSQLCGMNSKTIFLPTHLKYRS
jgi:hypothetical protein